MDIKELGTFYSAVDLSTGKQTNIQVFFPSDLSALADMDKSDVTGFFPTPFSVTYFKPGKLTTKRQMLQEAIRQATQEGNKAVFIDFS